MLYIYSYRGHFLECGSLYDLWTFEYCFCRFCYLSLFCWCWVWESCWYALEHCKHKESCFQSFNLKIHGRSFWTLIIQSIFSSFFFSFTGWGRGQQYNWRLRTVKLALFETKRVYNIAVIDAYVNAFSLRSVSQCICLICQIYTPSEAGPYFQVLFLLAVAAELHLRVLYLEGTRNLLLSGLINDIQFVVFFSLVDSLAKINFKMFSCRGNFRVGNLQLWYTKYCNT